MPGTVPNRSKVREGEARRGLANNRSDVKYQRPSAMSTHQTSQGAAGLSPEETELVKAELDRIVRSQGFRRSPRHARFLRFVCEATLNGESVQLNEYLIAHSVFDRG